MSDKVLVISGASRGIGLSTARQFLQHGYRVINLSRKQPPEKELTHLSVDLSDPNWIDEASDSLLAAVGDCREIALIHNAGLLRKDTVADVELGSALQVNVVASAQLNQLLLQQMGEGSSITYVGSTLSDKAVANTFSYVTCKHAVVGLMRASCQDLAGTGVHTSCVCPGFTATEMLHDHVGGSSDVLDAIASGITFNRLIEPEEIANTLYFAATNPVINGAVIHANLGQIES